MELGVEGRRRDVVWIARVPHHPSLPVSVLPLVLGKEAGDWPCCCAGEASARQNGKAGAEETIFTF